MNELNKEYGTMKATDEILRQVYEPFIADMMKGPDHFQKQYEEYEAWLPQEVKDAHKESTAKIEQWRTTLNAHMLEMSFGFIVELHSSSDGLCKGCDYEQGWPCRTWYKCAEQCEEYEPVRYITPKEYNYGVWARQKNPNPGEYVTFKIKDKRDNEGK